MCLLLLRSLVDLLAQPLLLLRCEPVERTRHRLTIALPVVRRGLVSHVLLGCLCHCGVSFLLVGTTDLVAHGLAVPASHVFCAALVHRAVPIETEPQGAQEDCCECDAHECT